MQLMIFLDIVLVFLSFSCLFLPISPVPKTVSVAAVQQCTLHGKRNRNKIEIKLK